MLGVRVFTVSDKKDMAKDVLWELFRTTGNLNYYEFYCRLKNGEENGRDSHPKR